MNLLDGMDGLASIVGLSTVAIMAVLATSMGHPHVAHIALILAGAILGFLVYNLPPASIYLGDSGSMVIGLVVGILGIQGSLKTTATLSLTAPVVVLSIPIIDTALAIIRRKLSGKSFAAADRGHIHHRLLDRGLNTWQALSIIGALCLATGAAATAATVLRSDALAWIITVSLVVLMVRLRAFGHHEWTLVRNRAAAGVRRIAARLESSQEDDVFPEPSLAPGITAFEPAWSELTAEASRCRVLRLEVRTGGGGRATGRLTWDGGAESPDAGICWSMKLMFGDTDSGFCEFRVEGIDPRSNETASLTHLTHNLRACGRHWCDQTNATPMVLPIKRSASHDDSQRRAA
ncbi:MAG: undecaprenyl/decaprenyl-phosphate alpha-N-acetylglucosaminyl 1-phosphate transferase [Proteobacteria bacterium]|nr:undecaprenyl/decaprenyl-phosphate alpha-N-acetylglucosaminyl 1-phosphate transferase [Pseudomonadota bacterium]